MSTHVIYYKGGAKMMHPVLNRESYLALRGSKKQKRGEYAEDRDPPAPLRLSCSIHDKLPFGDVSDGIIAQFRADFLREL